MFAACPRQTGSPRQDLPPASAPLITGGGLLATAAFIQLLIPHRFL